MNIKVMIENYEQAMIIYNNCSDIWENVDNTNGAKLDFLKNYYCESLDFPVNLKYNDITNKLSFETAEESININYEKTFNGFSFVDKIINDDFKELEDYYYDNIDFKR